MEVGLSLINGNSFWTIFGIFGQNFYKVAIWCKKMPFGAKQFLHAEVIWFCNMCCALGATTEQALLGKEWGENPYGCVIYSAMTLCCALGIN